MTTPYLFGSRILTHIAFWLLYFIAFGFIWAKDGNYYSSFYLEFILLPIRISAVYLMIYFVIPHTLLIKKYGLFLMQYILLLLISGVFQRLFTYFFYEANTTFQLLEIFNFGEILRAIILINSTVIRLVSSIPSGDKSTRKNSSTTVGHSALSSLSSQS